MTKVIKEQIKDYFDDHYNHFDGYPMDCTIYDENGEEKITYSFEECMKLIGKELEK